METDEVSRERWEEGDVAFRVAVLQDKVLPLHVPQLPQTLLPGVVATPLPERLRTAGENPDAIHFRGLLRLDGRRRHEETQGESDDAPGGAIPHGPLLQSVCRLSSLQRSRTTY
jgi:hypothetical protein